MFFLRPVLKASLALLVFLVLPSASVVFAQQQEDAENATTLVTSDDDKNTDSSSLLMTNYNALREEGQGFYLEEISTLYEKPDSELLLSVIVNWWCDLEFASNDADANNTDNYGYVGRAVRYLVGANLEDAAAKGAQISKAKKWALSVSAVMVPTLGIFEGQIHNTQDDWIIRYWDDGSSTQPLLGWEGHDEGDTSPNADTSALSLSGTFTKITTEAAAELLGMDVADMTPETCSTEYEAAWNSTHVPDPIDTSVTTLDETVAQLQANNKELLSRIDAIEGSLTADGSGDGDGEGENPTSTATSSSPFMVLYKYDIVDIVMKSFMTFAIIIGLVAVESNA